MNATRRGANEMGGLPGWTELETAVPQVTVTMLRYLTQIGCALRPGSVSGADQALRCFAAFLTRAAPKVTSIAQVTRRHIEDYKPWLAARPGQNMPRLTPATIARRLGTLRMFFIRLDEWGWDEAPPRVLPAVAVIAFWWNDWPGAQLSRPWTGLTDTILAAAAAVGLTLAGQAVIERPDVRAVFEAYRGPGLPVTFPATLPLAGAAFAAMLQLSLVCERWPLGGIGRIKSGIAALVLSWAIGAGTYFLLASLSYLPAPQRATAGLHNPGGPVATPDFGAALIAVGVWQAVFFIAWHGWPLWP